MPTVRRSARRVSRGFTLTELMVVVVIVGVLAAIGVMTFRKHVFSSRSVEALAMIQSIRVAQEGWRAEHMTYLDVSTTMDSTYPMATPGKTLHHWNQSSGADFARWQLLNPSAPNPVQFGYTTKAGPPFTAMVNPSSGAQPGWPAAAQVTEPWYVIQAKGDTNADGTFAYFVAASLNGEVFRENEGE